MGEYMIKNFEAMACGCVLLAYDQGEAENRAIGFVDMQNVVLYRGLDDFREKLRFLRENLMHAESIAVVGRDFVQARYGFDRIGKRLVEVMLDDLRARPSLGFFDGFLSRFWS